jgi:hypothetical protein
MLERGLKPAVHSKRRGRHSDGILLLHDNAHPYIVACMLETLRKLKWGVMEHPLDCLEKEGDDFAATR